MPTKTFMKLPKDKRLRILRAAKKEFSRVPLEKAVIANIVKDAEIPRGSFYQYFENIDDLFLYLLEYMYGIDKRKFNRYLKETNNDVYEALKMRFSNTIEKLANEENRQFRINIISTIFNDTTRDEKFVRKVVQPDTDIDISYFPAEIRESANSNGFVDIVKMIGKSCLNNYLSKSASSDQVINDYNNYIDMVKTGFKKSKKHHFKRTQY